MKEMNIICFVVHAGEKNEVDAPLYMSLNEKKNGGKLNLLGRRLMNVSGDPAYQPLWTPVMRNMTAVLPAKFYERKKIITYTHIYII